MADSLRSDTPPRPTALPVSPDAIPDALKVLPQWVIWRYFWKADAQKWTKPPLQARTGNAASSTNSKTWSTFDQAMTAYTTGQFDGIGISVCKKNGLIGIDLDHCRDPMTGEIAPWALEIVQAIASYTEGSPAGTGLRIWVRGTLPPGGRKRGHIEVYNSDRYLTITGDHLPDTPATIEPRQSELDALHARVFAPKATHTDEAADVSDNGAGPQLDDDALLEKAVSARNGGKFAQLWGGDTSDYARGQNDGESEADLALCNMLAFWTRDPSQIDRLFRRSALMRAKWDEPRGAETYGARTIARAWTQASKHWTPAYGGRSPSIRRAEKISPVSVEAELAAEREAIQQEPTSDEYPCPDALWIGVYAEVAKRLGKRSWEIWAGTTAALGAVAHRQIHVRYHAPLYGMVYVLVVKPTGMGKAECTNTCRALLPSGYVMRDAVQSAPGLAPILADIARGHGMCRAPIARAQAEIW